MIDKESPIIDQIEHMVRDIPGWTPIDQLFALYGLVACSGAVDGDVVEIGSWCGRSTLVLASALSRVSDTGKVRAIDLFPQKSDWSENEDGSFSFSVSVDGNLIGGYKDQTVWKEPFQRDIAPVYEKYEGIYDAFSASIDSAGLHNWIEAYKGDSNQLLSNPGLAGVRARLVFIDGDHSYEAVKLDIENALRVLAPNGWICFDDAFSHYDGVDKAIREFIIGSEDFAFKQQLTRKLFVAQRLR